MHRLDTMSSALAAQGPGHQHAPRATSTPLGPPARPSGHQHAPRAASTPLGPPARPSGHQHAPRATSTPLGRACEKGPGLPRTTAQQTRAPRPITRNERRKAQRPAHLAIRGPLGSIPVLGPGVRRGQAVSVDTWRGHRIEHGPRTAGPCPADPPACLILGKPG
jgi:hypothetical protein